MPSKIATQPTVDPRFGEGGSGLEPDGSTTDLKSHLTAHRTALNALDSVVTSVETRLSADEAAAAVGSAGQVASLDTRVSGVLSTETADKGSLDTRVSNEVSTRASQVNSLDTRVSSGLSTDVSTTTSLTTRVSTEESTRASADTSLTTAVSTNLSSRVSADASLTTRVSTEESTRASANTSLTTLVSTNLSSRVSADASLTTLASTNLSTSTSADLSLTTLASTNKSIATSSVTSLDTRVSTGLSTDVASTASLDTRVSTETSTRASVDASIVTASVAKTGLQKITLTAGSEGAEAADKIRVVGQVKDLAGTNVAGSIQVLVRSLAVTSDKGDLAVSATPLGTLKKANNPATGENVAWFTTAADGSFAFLVADDQVEDVLIEVTGENCVPSTSKLTFA